MKKTTTGKTKPQSAAGATADFERWVARQVKVIPADLALKHRLMAEGPFPFLRATFYRWTQLWPLLSPELARAPRVLAVGDLHVENFGTWRDAEGRLVWGVNDFDEAWPAAYTTDLVRLLASAYLAISEQQLAISRREARGAIESGYRDAISSGGAPLVLAEKHNWLRRIATARSREPGRFWRNIECCRDYAGRLPQPVRDLLRGSMPLKRPNLAFKTRVAGIGSLGHPRVLGLASWQGAHIVREAKALTRPAWLWAAGSSQAVGASRRQQTLIDRAVRNPDPHLHFRDGWVVRRLAPDCCHIELASLPQERDEERLLYAMGWETANLHLGSAAALQALKRDLSARRGRWLHKAAKEMADATRRDWKEWRRSRRSEKR